MNSQKCYLLSILRAQPSSRSIRGSKRSKVLVGGSFRGLQTPILEPSARVEDTETGHTEKFKAAKQPSLSHEKGKRSGPCGCRRLDSRLGASSALQVLPEVLNFCCFYQRTSKRASGTAALASTGCSHTDPCRDFFFLFQRSKVRKNFSRFELAPCKPLSK